MGHKEDEFSCSASGRKPRVQKSLNSSCNNLLDNSIKGDGKNIKIMFVNRYSDEDVKKWKRLYEELGSFRAVSRELKKLNRDGKDPSVPTIIKRLKDEFNKSGENFNDWVSKYDRYYSDGDVQEWKELYEKLGSFRSVSRELRKKGRNFNSLDASTISRRLKQKANKENWDFYDWFNQFSNSYSDEDIQEWKKLYEDLGSFRAVSREFCNNSVKKKPNAHVIIYRLKNSFQNEEDFNVWMNLFSQVEDILGKRKYSKDEVYIWERLYEQLGSFTAVSRYLRYENEISPCVTTVQLNLRDKFEQERRDFNAWVNDFFSPNSEINARIGKFIHNTLELIFIKFCLKRGMMGFYEIRCADGIFDNVMIKPTGQNKLLIIDYTISSEIEKVREHCLRGYQGSEKELVIVTFLSDKQFSLSAININEDIPFLENIRILNSKEFASFMGYQEEERVLYELVRYLGRRAFYDDDAYEDLKDLSRDAVYNLTVLALKNSLQLNDFRNTILLKGLGHLFPNDDLSNW